MCICQSCGTPVAGYNPSPVNEERKNDETSAKEKAPTKGTSVLSLTASIILKASAILLAVIAIIAVFGDFASVFGMTSYGVSYWFDSGWEVMKLSGNAYIGMKICFIIEFLLFVETAISIIISGVILISRTATSFAGIKTKPLIISRSLYVLIANAFMYFVLEKFAFSAYYSMDKKTSFGWGAILFFVFFGIFLAAFLFKKIANLIEKKKDYVLGIEITRVVISPIVLFVVLLVGFGAISGAEELAYSPFMIFQTFLTAVGSASEMNYVIAMIISFLSTGLYVAAFAVLLKCLNESIKDLAIVSKKSFIAPLSTSIVLLIAGLALAIVSIGIGNKTFDEIVVGPSAILGIVFTLLLVITNAVLSNVKVKKE